MRYAVLVIIVLLAFLLSEVRSQKVLTQPTGGTATVTAPVTLTYSGTNVTVDCSLSSKFRLRLTQDTGLIITNGTDGQDLTIETIQDGIGLRQITLSGTNWIGGTDVISGVTLTTTANYWDRMRISVVGSTYHLVGFVRGYSAPLGIP